MRRSVAVLLRQVRHNRQYSTQTQAPIPALSAEDKGKRKANYNVIDELESRGFVAALTHPQIRSHVDAPSCIYAGVDPSASSLHVGNLVALMGLLHFQLAGHKILALVGGATGSIGDPSGRSTERVALSEDILEENVRGITTQVHQFFERGESYLARKEGLIEEGSLAMRDGNALAGSSRRGEVEVLNNLEWFKGMGFLEFLREVGKLAKVNTMLARDSVKSRLDSESGISFTEFSYQLLQAYDFSILHRNHGCRMQLGGSDQWGNIVAGIDLIKRRNSRAQSIDQASIPDLIDGVEGKQAEDKDGVFGITLPLLTAESGEKFGKSAGNAVWLDPERTSVSDFYQFFLRLPDSSIEQYLKLFTLLPIDRIRSIMAEHDADRASRTAQVILAEEITELVHGFGALRRSQSVAKLLYRTPVESLRAKFVLPLLSDEPFFHRVKWDDIEGIPFPKLVSTYKLCKSRADANRAIKHNSLTLNGQQVTEQRQVLQPNDLLDGHLAIIRLGKKHLVLFVDFDALPSQDSTKSSLDEALDWLEAA